MSQDRDGPQNGEVQRYKNDLVTALRSISAAEREDEEERLRKRAERANGGSARSASVVPGTPVNGAAPEPKPMTKKELAKQDKGKSAFTSHDMTNSTMNIMLGGGKKKKQYSWMSGGGGSGASTPGKTSVSSSTANALGGAAEKVRLTAEGGRSIGGLREADQKMVEMKDWILALEHDGKDKKSLQRCYLTPSLDKK